MIKYRKNFLKKIENLLFSLVKFLANRSIILKKYSKNYKINKLNKKLIIIIIHNKNTFSINNN